MLTHLILAALLTVTHLAVMARSLLVESRNPYSRAAWLLVLLLLPVIGVAAYVLFGEPWVARQFQRRARKVFRKLEWRAGTDSPVALQSVPERFHAAFRVCERIGRWPVVGGNKATIAADSNDAIDAMVRDFDEARETIHISFYIWLADRNGLRVVQALERAALRGVVCRIMADAIGSRALIASEHWRAMRQAGVRLCVSLRMRRGLAFLEGSRIDLRNHRKIVVVDDRITYCGSQNCADEAFRVKAKYAPWVDIMLRLQGPVVTQMQLLFASDWMQSTGEEYDPFRPAPAMPPGDGTGSFPALVVGDGPTERPRATPHLVSTLIASAQRELLISTPYFVPDATVLEALCAAAWRGVRVTLIVPQRNDSWIVGAASRSTYYQLLRAGVAIQEYRGGLLHSKSLCVDGEVAMIGSTNLDLRSFDLNFENNVLLQDSATTGAIRERQLAYVAQSQPVTLAEVRQWPWPRRMWNNLMATLGPVL